MEASFYNSPEWRSLRDRALARDGDRCTVSRLLGGGCSDLLHVHHLVPVSAGGTELPGLDGVLTACAVHHPMLEALRRAVLRYRQRDLKRCRHNHRYDHARRECRERLNRVA